MYTEFTGKLSLKNTSWKLISPGNNSKEYISCSDCTKKQNNCTETSKLKRVKWLKISITLLLLEKAFGDIDRGNG